MRWDCATIYLKEMSEEFFLRIIGVDIGGTALKWGISDGGNFIERGTCESFASLGASKLIDNLLSLLDGMVFDAIGVSTAGIVAPDGSIKYANENIPGYTGTRLREILTERYNVPCEVLNDISAAAYSEIDNYSDFYYLALGTGVGGIHVKDGEVMRGSSGIAGQIGYLPSKKLGTIDFDASTRGLNLSHAGGAKELFSLTKAGNSEAEEKILTWCDELCHVIAHIVGFINPPVIVIGGGISGQGEALIKMIERRLDALPIPYRDTFEIKTAEGANYAAVSGIIKYLMNKRSLN